MALKLCNQINNAKFPFMRYGPNIFVSFAVFVTVVVNVSTVFLRRSIPRYPSTFLSLSCSLPSLVKPIHFYTADKSFPLHFYSMELHATQFSCKRPRIKPVEKGSTIYGTWQFVIMVAKCSHLVTPYSWRPLI